MTPTPTRTRYFLVMFGQDDAGNVTFRLFGDFDWLPADRQWVQIMDTVMVEHGVDGVVAFRRSLTLGEVTAWVSAGKNLVQHADSVSLFLSTRGRARITTGGVDS